MLKYQETGLTFKMKQGQSCILSAVNKRSIIFSTCLVSPRLSGSAGHHYPYRGSQENVPADIWCNANG